MPRHLRKLMFLFVALALLSAGSVTLTPEPAEAWATCKGGTWLDDSWKCQLGIHRNCSECIVIPDK